MTGEENYQRALSFVARGNEDQAAVYFQRAGKQGIDVANRFKSETEESINAAKVQIKSNLGNGAEPTRKLPQSSGSVSNSSNGFIGKSGQPTRTESGEPLPWGGGVGTTLPAGVNGNILYHNGTTWVVLAPPTSDSALVWLSGSGIGWRELTDTTVCSETGESAAKALIIPVVP